MKWFACCYCAAVIALLPMPVTKAAPALQMPLATRSLLLDIERADERLVAVGERGHILYSDDWGDSWTQAQVPTRQMLTATYFVDGQRGWTVGHDGMILSSVDGGENWVVQRDGLAAQDLLNRQKVKLLAAEETQLRAEVLSAASLEEREALQLQLEDLMLDSDDARFALRNDVHAPPLLDVWFADELNGIAVGAFNTALLTDDGGVSWKHIAARFDNFDEFHLNAVTGSADGNIWVAGEGGVLFHSADMGQNWTRLNSPYGGSWFGISRDARTGQLLVFGLRGNIFRSDDGGETWRAAASEGDRSLAGGGYLNQRYAILVGAVGALQFSQDGGQSFVAHPLPNRVNLSSAVCVEARIVAVGQGGIHITPMPDRGEQP